MKTKFIGLVLFALLCVSCAGAGSGGSGDGTPGAGDQQSAGAAFDPSKVSGTGCDAELQDLTRASVERKAVNMDNLGKSWGGQWELICGLTDTNQCPPPNSFYCDFGNITLIAQDNKMQFRAVGTTQNIDEYSQWFLALNSGSDSDLTRTVALETPNGSTNLEISLFYDTSTSNGFMVMVRGDYNRRTVYRSKTTGAPSY